MTGPLPLARIEPPQKPLGALRLLLTTIRNPIDMWPAVIYREKVYSRRLAGRDSHFVCDPAVIKDVLVDKVDAFVKAEEMRRALEPGLGTALLTAEGEHWRRQRRAAAPLFRHEKLLAFVPDMVAAADRAAERFAQAEGREIDIVHEMMLASFDVITRTMLSSGDMDPERVQVAVSDYLDPVGWVVAYTLARLPSATPYPGRRKRILAGDFLRNESIRMIAERRAAAEKPRDLMTLLLEAADPETGRHMDDREVANNLVTFITAGHETGALALTWAFYLLDRHPWAADRIREEVEAATGGGPLEAGHASALVFTRQVLQEAMRLYPPAAILARNAVRDVTCGGLEIRSGSQVYVPIYALHRHETLWDEPDAFDPSRFETPAVQARSRYAFLPFGGGPRICIGMSFALIESSIILARLVREFRPVMREGYMPKLRLRVSLRPGKGMPMTIRRAGGDVRPS